MNKCSDVQDLLDAYIDNELSSSEAAAVQRHVESCHTCSAHLKELEELKRALREAPRPQVSLQLRERVVQGIRQEKRSPISLLLRGRPHGLIAAGLAAAALVAGVILWSGGLFKAQEPMYASILADHRRSLSSTAKTDMMTSDRQALWSWLNEHTSFLLPPSLVARIKLGLLGGRFMKMDGEEAASIQYSWKGGRVSLIAMDSHDPMPASSRKRMFKGRALFIDTYKGYNVLMWHEGGLLVCAVTALDSKEIMDMLFEDISEGPLKV